MKKNVSKLWLFLAMALVAPAFTACDDDEGDNTDYAPAIEGTYAGTIKYGTNDIPGTYEIVIDYASQNKVDLIVNNLIVPTGGQIEGLPANLNLSATCNDAQVSSSKGKTHVKGATTINLTEAYKNIPVTIEGDIDSSYKIDLDITVTLGIIPLTIKYSGAKEQ